MVLVMVHCQNTEEDDAAWAELCSSLCTFEEFTNQYLTDYEL